MTRAAIGTKLHDARESDPTNPFLMQMHLLPHFVFQKELMEMFNTQTAQNSVRVMMDHDMGALPYPQMTIELWGGNDWRYFWIVAEGKEPGQFELLAIEFVNGSSPPWDLQMAVSYVKNPQLLDPKTRDQYYSENPNVGETPAWNIKWSDHRRAPDRSDMIHHGLAALQLALLMTHMTDLDREPIEPRAIEKLNKNRRKSNRPTIHDHTIVRIGHYYDRDGVRHPYVPGTRGSMVIHMREAHSRRQHHGERWVRDNPEEAAKPWNTKDMHTVFIPAVFVNYRDGSELPLPKPKLVKL